MEGGGASSCGGGSRWAGRERCDKEGKAGRGELRHCLAHFPLCKCWQCRSTFLVLWGLFYTELNSKWRVLHTPSCPGKLPEGASLSV